MDELRFLQTMQLKTRLNGNAKYLMPSAVKVKVSYKIKAEEVSDL